MRFAMFCCRASVLLVVAIGSQSVAAQSDSFRVTNGLQHLYDFRGGSGSLVKDRSELSPPLDLKIERPRAVKWSDGSLEVHGKTTIHSDQPPQRLIQAVKRSGELTVEAWVTPSKASQQGPARIVTLSKNGNERNFTLGHEGGSFDARLRTTKTSSNGIPSTASDRKAAKTQRTHVVYTRDRSGQARVYVNGKVSGERQVAGAPTNWDANLRLGLANEFATDRQWLGRFHLVAIYSRSLSEREVQQNFRAGPVATAPTPEALAQAKAAAQARHFETEIAPLLSRHCLECHDTSSHEGELDLSRKLAAFAGGDSGKAIVAGKPSMSLLWKSVQDDTMPLERAPLSKEEKSLLKKWIEDGAVWSVDWIDPAIYKSERGGETWVRRLTVAEYIATVRATIGVDVAEEARRLLPPDKRADGFSNTAYNLNVDFEHVDAYARLAEIAVKKMDVGKFTSRFTKRKRLIDDDMRALVANMGKWILRGPLDEREVVDFRGITTSVASAGGSFDEAASFVIQAMLQSPRFIYRIENQRGDGEALSVEAFELASRISYITWGAPPDEALYRDADSGELYSAAVVRKHVERMMEDPRAIQQSERFVSQWLDLDRLSHLQPNREQFPAWNAEFANDMRRETLAYFHDVVWKQGRPLTHLLNAQVTFVTPRLAKHYGIDAATAGSGDDEVVRRDLNDVASRGGLLTQGSLLTIGGDDASMVTRGLFVLNDLLFSEVGDPPPGLDTTPIPPSPGKSHRAISRERIESSSCGGCHARFEPLAFGLEKYDGLGSFHEVDEHGNRLREDGEILFPGAAEPVSYQSAAELMNLLAESPRVAECLTRKLTQFAIGRPLVAADAAEVRRIHQAAKQAGGTYAATLSAIVTSDLVLKTRTQRE